MTSAPEAPRDSGQTWLDSRSGEWREIEAELPSLADNKPVAPKQIDQAMRRYPELARDLAIARRTTGTSRLSAYLEFLYQGLYRALFRPPKLSRDDIRTYFLHEVPAISYQLRWHIFSVLVGFILATTAGWILVSQFPELATLFASEEMINKVQRGELWTDGLLNIMPSSMLSIQILTNNIVVSLTAMSLGVLYGLGTIYIIGLNGLMLGGIFAFVAVYGMDDELLTFVIAHGLVELSIIVIAGAIGFSIGESLARPGHRTRLGAFQASVRDGARLMLLCVAFLVGAGFIEGYVSPDPQFSFNIRLVIGVVYWLLLAYALMGFNLTGFLQRSRP